MAKVKVLQSLLLLVLVPGLLLGFPPGMGMGAEKTTPSPTTKPEQGKQKNQPAAPTAQDFQKLSEEVELFKNLSITALLFAVVALLASLYELFKTSGLQPKQDTETSSNKSNNAAENQPQSLVNELHQRISLIENSLKKLEDQKTFQGNSPYSSVAATQKVTPAYQSPTTPVNQSLKASTKQYLTSQSSQLVAAYNENPDSLSRNAIEVSEAAESITQRRIGSNQAVILEKNRKGNYWILNSGGFNYLLPKGKIKINEYNYETVEVLFECQGYQPGYSSYFKLLKPAMVSPIGEKWQIEETGILQF